MKRTKTHINEVARKSLDITRDEYALCAYLFFRQAYPSQKAPGWCSDSREEIADFVGITRQGLFKMLARLSGIGLVEQDAKTGCYRASAMFADADEGVNKVYVERKQSLHEGVNKVYVERKQSLPNKEERKERKKKEVDEIATPPTAETFSLNDKSAAGNPHPSSAPPPPAAPAWQPFTPSGELQKMRTDFRCVERFQKETGLPESQYETAIDAFALVAETITHGGPNDLRQHFFNWSRKPEVVERLRPKPQQQINRSPYAAPAGPVKFAKP